MKLFKKAKRGFTLVELVVVIAVIAILAAVSVGAYFGITESANNSRLEQEARSVHTSIQLVASGTDDNARLSKNGLIINNLQQFDTKIDEMMGKNHYITNDTNDVEVIEEGIPAICLSIEAQPDSLLDTSGSVYKTFDYYNPDVSGKKANVDIVTGETKILPATFSIGERPNSGNPSYDSLEGIVGSNAKLEYFAGETIDLTDIVIIAKYSNYHVDELDVTDKVNSPSTIPLNTMPGPYIITFSYTDENGLGTHTWDFEITIIEVVLDSIELTNDINNLIDKQYFVGETISIEGLTFQEVMNDGSKGESFDSSNENIKISDSYKIATLGQTDIQVEYKNHILLIENCITVDDIVLQEITVTPEEGFKTQYYKGFDQDFDFTNLKIVATYNNGSFDVEYSDDKLSYSPSFEEVEIGENKEITFTYTDKGVSVSDKITVNIGSKEITNYRFSDENYKKSYVVGQKLDLGTTSIIADYNVGEDVTLIPGTHFELPTIDKVGTHDYEVECNLGGTITFKNIEAVAVQTTKLELKDEYKILGQYYVGDPLPSLNEDVKFILTFNNGSTVEITGDKVSYVNSICTKDQNSVQVTYTHGGYNAQTCTIKFEHTVQEIMPIELDVSALSNVVNVGTPTKEGLVLKYNKPGHPTSPADSSKITTNIDKIDSNTKSITYTYTDGSIVLEATLEINQVTDIRTYYFADQDWWHADTPTPYIQIFNGDGGMIFGESEFGIPMEEVEDSYTEFTTSAVYKATIDVIEATRLQVNRCFVGDDGQVRRENARTSYTLISEITDNMIVLTPNTSWLNGGSDAEITYEHYEEGVTVKDLHIVGLGSIDNGSWECSDNTRLNYDPSKKIYKKENVRIENSNEFKFRLSNFGDKYFGYGIIIIGSINNYLSGEPGSNIKVLTGGAGIYTITVDVKNCTYTFEKTDSVIMKSNYYLVGSIIGWNENDNYEFTSTDGGLTYTITHTFKRNEEFKAKFGETRINNIDEGMKRYFYTEGNGNIFAGTPGTFTLKIEIDSNNASNSTICLMSENIDLETETLYLKPNDDWKKDNARFAAYFFQESESKVTWVNMNDTDGDGIYEVEIPRDHYYTKVIFCRMNSNTSENNWENKWNQTGDLSISLDGNNLYTITSIDGGQDNKSKGTRSPFN